MVIHQDKGLRVSHDLRSKPLSWLMKTSENILF
jgi:hypothetical protein